MFPSVSASSKDEGYFIFNKFHHLFTHTQVIKYTIWFNSLSKNNSRNVVLDDLAQALVDHKLIRSKAELVNAFSTFLKQKIEINDFTYTVNIDEFLDVLSKSSRIIDMEKMDELVDMENKLSEQTLVYHERRKLLMNYVMENRIRRAKDMEIMYGRVVNRPKNVHTGGNSMRRLKNGLHSLHHQHSSTSDHSLEEKLANKEILESHRKQIDDATRFVGKVEFDFYCMKYGSKFRAKRQSLSASEKEEQAMRLEQDEVDSVMLPLEDILDSELLEMASETRQILYEDTADDDSFNTMLSPTMLGSRRTVAPQDLFCDEGSDQSTTSTTLSSTCSYVDPNHTLFSRMSPTRSSCPQLSRNTANFSSRPSSQVFSQPRRATASSSSFNRQQPSNRIMMRPASSRSPIVTEQMYGEEWLNDSSRPTTSTTRHAASLVLNKNSWSAPNSTSRKSTSSNKLKLNFNRNKFSRHITKNKSGPLKGMKEHQLPSVEDPVVEEYYI